MLLCLVKERDTKGPTTLLKVGIHPYIKYKQKLLGKKWCDYRFLSLCCIEIKSHFEVINKYNCNNDLGTHGNWGTNYFPPLKCLLLFINLQDKCFNSLHLHKPPCSAFFISALTKWIDFLTLSNFFQLAYLYLHFIKFSFSSVKVSYQLITKKWIPESIRIWKFNFLPYEQSPPFLTFCMIPTAFIKSKPVTLPLVGLAAVKELKN